MSLTPEQLQFVYRLESIFMPLAREQRIKAGFSDDGSGTPIRLAHYTSADAALKIIKSKRIWMRNVTCMADYREVHHGFDLLKGYFSDDAKRNAFVAALDACHQGVALEAIGEFDQRWSDIQLRTYVTSISEHDNSEDLHGRLSMWRAFGNNPARVAIVFRVPGMSSTSGLSLGIFFSPVAYLTEAQTHGVINKVVENIGREASFLRTLDRNVVKEIVCQMFSAAVTCLKHEGFREEREWRAIYLPRTPSPLMKASTEIVGGIPQNVFNLPLDVTVSPDLADLDFAKLFDRLIIGPTPYPYVMYEAFVQGLMAVGVSDAATRVVRSNIPIRA